MMGMNLGAESRNPFSCRALSVVRRLPLPVPRSISIPRPTRTRRDAKWTWTTDANVFFGYNYQQRKFADFAAWESQNWVMLDASAAHAAAGRLTIDRHGCRSSRGRSDGWSMPVAIARARLIRLPGTRPFGGSPQLFQTGESYQQIPLVNFQHPHDLIMGLGATYRVGARAVAYVFGADLVGSPTLGPTAFMHRESARDNPQVPLTHHDLDSTHITPGVLRAGRRNRRR